jgi:hypothetical protein
MFVSEMFSLVQWEKCLSDAKVKHINTVIE